jgi:hypothetical protein
MEQPHSAITGAYLEDIQGYQKGQYDCQDRVNMLGRKINEDADIYNEIDVRINEFPPNLLNQLRTELGSAMNRASVHQLSIKYYEDLFASLRRLQEYIGLFVNFVSTAGITKSIWICGSNTQAESTKQETKSKNFWRLQICLSSSWKFSRGGNRRQSKRKLS